MDWETPVIVIGGGIGGLAAAIGLRRVGIPVAVYERAPEIREVGAGLSLWSNAVMALRRLGVEQALLEKASVIQRGITLTWRGKVLNDDRLGDAARQFGAATVCAHRADLQGVLASALDPQQIHLDCTCVGFDEDDRGVTTRFANGKTARGTLLVGADGIRSAVRAQLHGNTEPRYAGYVAWRGIAHCEHPDLPAGTIKFALGAGAQLGFLPCGPGRVYWFATINGPRTEAADPHAWKREALERFRNWFPLVPAGIEATEPGALIKSDIIDRPPLWPWGKGRVTLLGDAVHPTTPNLGQGACQALEDAVILADILRREGLTPEALRRYEETRRERTAMVTNESWALGKMFQWESPLATWFRNLLIRSPLGRAKQAKLVRELLSYPLPEL